MVVAHHLLWTIYGYWLPNDPRGSMSHLIRDDEIAQLGPAHFERKRVQPSGSELRAFHKKSAKLLKHELKVLSPHEAASVATSFGEKIQERGYTC